MQLIYQGLGAIPWGIFFAVAPIYELIVFGFVIWGPLLYWREKKRTKKYGFLPGGPIRLTVVLLIIISAVMIPNKFEDQVLELPKGERMSLEQIRSAARNQNIRLPFFTYDRDSKAVSILIPQRTMTVGELFDVIEDQTGKVCRAGYCGNEMTFFKGSFVMDIYLRDRN